MLVTTDADHSDRLVIRRDRLVYRLVATVLATRLDRRLAAGSAPEASLLLAVRAQQLISPAGIDDLAVAWQDVIDLSYESPSARSPRVRLSRDRIHAADSAIRELIALLRGATPTTARGAALATMLLRDGAGPLYNRRSAVDLPAAIAEVSRALDPITGLASVG
jgi:hypothetical protein